METKAYLEIEYRPSYWVHRLRAELDKTPALAAADANWRTSGLLDLAFSLETRIGNLTEVVRQVNESIRIIDQEFHNEADLEALLAGGYAYRVKNEVALRRIIIGLNNVVIEARACFENLAKFYREFVRNYFGENVSQATSYERIATAVPSSRWAEDLRLRRHDIVHERSPWIRFEVRPTAPKYHAVLILEYRIDAAPAPEDEISLESLQNARVQLSAALEAIRAELIQRVVALRQ